MRRRTLPALLVSLALLAACGSDAADTGRTSAASAACPSAKALDAVKVTEAKGKAPALDFKKPFSVDKTACRVIHEGDGDVLAKGSTAIFNFVFVNGRDGKELSSSYGGDQPAEVVLDDKLLRGVRVGLEGVRAGSRVLVAITPDDGFGPKGDDPQSGMKATDTLLFFADVTDARTPLARAKGTTVTPKEGLPTVTLAKDGAPTITVPKAAPPAELVAQPLIEGKGPKVASGQTITVHYTGVLWDTGEEFDSSWKSGSPASFPIGTGGVIAGWDKGLVGRTVGSQVLLVVPPADGYPNGSGSIPPGATLVFVVDILDAHS
jgi:peptidylprolyl isomerase